MPLALALPLHRRTPAPQRAHPWRRLSMAAAGAWRDGQAGADPAAAPGMASCGAPRALATGDRRPSRLGRRRRGARAHAGAGDRSHPRHGAGVGGLHRGRHPYGPEIEATLSSVLACKSPDFVPVRRRTFEAQPHFRSAVGLSLPNEAPVEMGFFFAASYDARLLGAGVTMNMNPGYSMQPSSAGLLSAELINDRVNVSGIGHVPGADAEAIREQLRNGLRNDLPRSLERIVANVLTYPLQGPLATSCDNSAQCLPRVRRILRRVPVDVRSDRGIRRRCSGHPKRRRPDRGRPGPDRRHLYTLRRLRACVWVWLRRARSVRSGPGDAPGHRSTTAVAHAAVTFGAESASRITTDTSR